MRISKRMSMVCSLVERCEVVADVGCDHGYLSIWLCRERVCDRAFAMDLRKGPLERADKNIRFFHMDERIRTILSDGLLEYPYREADTICIAGMGGELMIHILSDREDLLRSAKQLILQPQSDIPEVRRFLHQKGYRITKENMCMEDGKYYSCFRAVPGYEVAYSEAEYLVGRHLLPEGKEIGISYITELMNKNEGLIEQLSKADTELSRGRLEMCTLDRLHYQEALSLLQD